MSKSIRAIKAIFFDFDGVLTTDQSGTRTTVQSLSQSTGLPEGAIREAFTPHIGDLILGRQTHEQIWPQICSALGSRIDPAFLVEAFGSTPLNQPMLHVARALAGRYRIGIITDNPSDRMKHIAKLHGLDSLFDPIVVSADIGSSKHTSGIFQLTLDAINNEPSETIFIDNSEKNLAVAKKLGINVIHHDDKTNDVAQLRDILAGKYRLAIPGATQHCIRGEPAPWAPHFG